MLGYDSSAPRKLVYVQHSYLIFPFQIPHLREKTIKREANYIVQTSLNTGHEAARSSYLQLRLRQILTFLTESQEANLVYHRRRLYPLAHPWQRTLFQEDALFVCHTISKKCATFDRIQTQILESDECFFGKDVR